MMIEETIPTWQVKHRALFVCVSGSSAKEEE